MRGKRLAFPQLLVLIVLAALAAPGIGVCTAQEAQEPYRPSFTVDVEKGIFDRGKQIVSFDATQMKECKPCLRYVVLKPGGEVNLDELQCYWLTANCKLKNMQVEAEGQGTDRLLITFRSEDEKGRYVDERQVVVSYDARIKSYVYDSTARFIVQEGKTFRASYLEYTDPHWIHCGLPGPSLPTDFINKMAGGGSVWPIFRPATGWKPLFQFFVYEAADGNVYKVHLNHKVTRTHNSLPLKQDAIYAAVYNPQYGNVGFQLLGDTGPRTDTEICSWGYDIHMRLRLSETGGSVTLKGGDEIVARFKTYQLPDRQALALMRRARPRPLPPEQVLSYLTPVFRLHSTFRETMDPYKTGGDVDPEFWEPFGKFNGPATFLSTTGPVWSTKMGRTDKYCVGCVHPEPQHSGWECYTGVSHWTGKAPPEGKVYKVSAFVKMKDVKGKGAYFSLKQWSNEKESKPLTGTCDWKEVSMLAPPGWGGMGNFVIGLNLDGTGEVWWDDVRLEVVDAPKVQQE